MTVKSDYKRKTEYTMKIAFHTLGCKVNQYETQALKEKFIERGYEITSDDDFADVYVINTCTVTGLSDRKSRQFIRRVKKINPDSITAVIGCYVQVSPEEASQTEGVDLIAGTNEKNHLPEYIEEYLMGRGSSVHIKEYDQLTEYEETGIITSMDTRTRAFIKIQEGCDRFCSYCIIPYARGAVRSRARTEIVKEAERLIEKGYKELVLTGINTALYGMEKGFDSRGGKQEAVKSSEDEVYGIEIIVKALDELPGDFRIRLGSLEPNVISAEYAKRLLKYKRLCPHMHLSLQSGSDRILKQMNRNYASADYLKLVDLLKEHDPGYGITTDIIVGFPGETEEDFSESVKIVKKAGLSKVHVFKYSKREGTKAAEMKEQIAPQIKAKRSEELIKAGEEAGKRFLLQNLGTIRTVLIEQCDPNTGLYEGFSENYIKVYCRSDQDISNQFAAVKLIEVYSDGVLGNLINS
jgi:threonylcarbamoyladenosine tRNA methylthiotransferase MtaB